MKKKTSSFSWSRVAQLYLYNAPWIRKQTTIYFLVSLATSLLYLLIPYDTLRMAVYSPCSTILLFMFIWAPIVFTKGEDTRIIDRLIPASPTEKFVFYISYLFVIIGLACFFFPLMAEKAFQILYPGEEGSVETLKTALDLPEFYGCAQYLSDIAAMMTCFYCVVAVKRDRVMKAYLLSICVLFLTSSLNMFYGLKESVVFGLKEATGNENGTSETEVVEKMYSAMNDHLNFLILCMAGCLLYILWLMWMSYRSLYRRNL